LASISFKIPESDARRDDHLIVKHLSEVVPERVGDFRRWYLSRADRGHSLSVRYVEVDGIVAPHTHSIEETIFYIEGHGLARVGEKEIKIKPGTMLVIPPGTVHSSIREGLEKLTYLAIFVGNPEL
jgi:quercetin dioxygenase-like cupin family protein